MRTYTLGGGCFWCLDAVFRRVKGVSHVVSGYAGGDVKDPSYHQVSTSTTGHAEVVQVTFDETILPPDTLLDIFFTLHDPTTRDRQGADIGPQYRSIMLYADDIERDAFEAAKARAESIWEKSVVTAVEPLDGFYEAELEHQDYFNKNPSNGYCSIVITPKIVKVRKRYKEWFLPA